jgi:hypothetical protein
MSANTLRFHAASFHRNGVGGEGYHRIQFETIGGEHARLQAVIFEAPGHLAVIDERGRSWRCEDFECELRAFLASPEGEHMIWGSLAPALAAVND